MSSCNVKVVTMLMCSMVLLSGCGKNTDAISSNSSSLIHTDNPAEENRVEMLQDLASGVTVQIQNGAVTGSGVLWDVADDKLVIATAAHVYTMGSGDMEVTFADGRTLPIAGCEVTEQDLAFLFVNLQDMEPEHMEQYQPVKADEESASKLQSGDGIMLVAFGAGMAVEVCEGEVVDPWIYVEDFGQHMLVVRVDAEAGMSGGGVFDEEGHFLGILCGKSEDGEAAVIPLSVMDALYHSFSEKF